jgi:hypothetical protein
MGLGCKYYAKTFLGWMNITLITLVKKPESFWIISKHYRGMEHH